MILAAGLTPAWQQIVVLDALRVGEVNRAREVRWCASGKVLNVGRALHSLGVDSLTLSLAGGAALPEFEREFAADQVSRRWVTSSVPTRVCTTILDQASGDATELVENAKPVPPEEFHRFRDAYTDEASRAEIVVVTGSLPNGAPHTFYRDLLAVTPGRVILDARGDGLLVALEHRPFVVKPNREELGQTLGIGIDSDARLQDAACELCRRGAAWSVITQGQNDVWVCSADEVFRICPPRVDVVNAIGSGDCLAAGIAWGLQLGYDVPESVRLGMACAADNVRQLLPARLEPGRVRELMKEIKAVR
ncbi:MAG: bifunctional hydroxymethylpyrimidine kinase/phosphomethylpyrimidine kinase [Planctomycetales bacterium]|nr:bifunctional hydroxymethylpyrimidine kinase/phosphomethylpyrimidine kinase [Planctomycetales bacterium]